MYSKVHSVANETPKNFISHPLATPLATLKNPHQIYIIYIYMAYWLMNIVYIYIYREAFLYTYVCKKNLIEGVPFLDFLNSLATHREKVNADAGLRCG